MKNTQFEVLLESANHSILGSRRDLDSEFEHSRSMEQSNLSVSLIRVTLSIQVIATDAGDRNFALREA